uniref:Uncharacterized protein n=1 Tax=Oryza glumipatula TaxID=40148 RepID=A0A0E0A6K2_9ORYZ
MGQRDWMDVRRRHGDRVPDACARVVVGVLLTGEAGVQELHAGQPHGRPHEGVAVSGGGHGDPAEQAAQPRLGRLGRWGLLQRLGYVTRVAYPLASLLLTVYCVLPAVCLLTGKSTFPGDVNYYDGILLILLLFSVATSVVLELRWSCVPLRAWWSDEKL